jgi:hypothetical protein
MSPVRSSAQIPLLKFNLKVCNNQYVMYNLRREKKKKKCTLSVFYINQLSIQLRARHATIARKQAHGLAVAMVDEIREDK